LIKIERATRKNRSRKRGEQQSQKKKEESYTIFDRDTQVIQEEISTVEDKIHPPRRILRDYALQQGPRNFFSIAVLATLKHWR